MILTSTSIYIAKIGSSVVIDEVISFCIYDFFWNSKQLFRVQTDPFDNIMARVIEISFPTDTLE